MGKSPNGRLWSGSQCELGSCSQAAVAGSLSMGGSQRQATCWKHWAFHLGRLGSRAPSQRANLPTCQSVTQSFKLAALALALDLRLGLVHHGWHGRASAILDCSIIPRRARLPHIDHGGDWCLGLRRRQKLQFQPHPSLQHLLNGRLCPGRRAAKN